MCVKRNGEPRTIRPSTCVLSAWAKATPSSSRRPTCKYVKLHPKGLRGGPGARKLAGAVRVPENHHARDPGQHLPKELHPLRGQLFVLGGESRNIPTRSSEAGASD